MMIISESYYIYLMMLANAGLLAIVSITLLRVERRSKRIEEFRHSPTGTSLAEAGDVERREQLRATRRLEQKLDELQKAVIAMQKTVPDERASLERNLPIENAVRMARHGASIDDLTRSCGLNIGEARLMQKLHGQAGTAANG